MSNLSANLEIVALDDTNSQKDVRLQIH